MKIFPSRKFFNKVKKIGYISELKKHQWLNEGELKEIQERKLIKTIEHAYSKVPFYNDMFNAIKVKPYDIKSISDLKKLPIISKKDIQDNYPNNILSRNAKRSECRISSTSGSSGLPLKLWVSDKDGAYRSAVNRFIWFEAGVKILDKIVTIRGDSAKQSWLNKLGFLKTKNISIFSLHDDLLKELIRIKPDVIYTYPSILYLLKERVIESGKTFANPKVIFTTGEALPPFLRKELSKIYNSEIFNIYASVEFGHLAFECNEHRGYHTITDTAVIEILKNGEDVGPGEKGEVVVTGFHNEAMPLIRYKLGDIAIPSENKCPCGRGFPLISSIEGREDDFLILPSGKKISPRMINLLEFLTGIVAYKIIQESPSRIVVKVVKNEDFCDSTIREIQKVIRSGCSGESVDVEVELVERIPQERTGKLRAVISKVTNVKINEGV
jgi:phenylacetate-CoA ligase